MGGASSKYGRQERCMQSLVGKHEGRKALGTSKRRWEDNIKRDLEEMGWESWTRSGSEVGGCCECGNEPSCSIR